MACMPFLIRDGVASGGMKMLNVRALLCAPSANCFASFRAQVPYILWRGLPVGSDGFSIGTLSTGSRASWL